jgi:hypothetical protein
MRLISACRVARYTSCRLAGYWRLVFGEHNRASTHTKQWSRVKLLLKAERSSPPPTQRKKRTRTTTAQALLHRQRTQSTSGSTERPPPLTCLTSLCLSAAGRTKYVPLLPSSHRIASPSIPDGPLSGPVLTLALALALAHCHSPPF